MKHGVYTKTAMAVMLVMACVGLAACGGSGDSTSTDPAGLQEDQKNPEVKAPQDVAAPEEPAAAAPASEPAPTTAEQAPAAADDLEKEPAAAAGGALTADTLPGTKWSAGALTIAFQEDGKLMVNDASEGTWKLEGDSLTVSAMGMEITAQIEGDTIMYNGSPVERIQ